jgi:hypothetical protein
VSESDPLEGLPPDLARLLRDPRIIVPQDQAVFELIASWMDAPSDTASAMSVDDWRQAWSVLWRRHDALAERVLALEGENAQLKSTLRETEHRLAAALNDPFIAKLDVAAQPGEGEPVSHK